MTVRELGARMGADEIAGWRAYFKLEAEDMDVRMGKRPKRSTAKKNASIFRSWFAHKVRKESA